MNRMSLNSPCLLGFEEIEELLESTAKTDGYPPYNIEHTGDAGLKIALAVAGFTVNDLSVTVAESQLIIRGRQNAADGKTFLHRGIAAHPFQKNFVLASGMEVEDAELIQGLLIIALRRKRPESEVRTIPVRSGEVQSPGAITRTR